MTAIIDIEQQARRLLVSQFKSSARLQQLVSILVAPFQEIEFESQRLLYLRSLDLADGLQLDRIGGTLDFPRGGLSDAEYRDAIRLRIRRNVCSGSPDDIIDYARRISGATVMGYSEGDAKFEIEHNGDPLILTDEVLADIAPAGVGAHAEFVTP